MEKNLVNIRLLISSYCLNMYSCCSNGEQANSNVAGIDSVSGVINWFGDICSIP